MPIQCTQITKVGMTVVKSRHVLSVMCFLGLMIVYLLRVNLSVAIVAMAGSDPSSDSNSSDQECSYDKSTKEQRNISRKGELDLNSKDRGIILSAFYYGYVVSNVFGGRLSENFGGVRVFGLGILITSIVTLFTPLAARSSKAALIVLRVLEGLSEGVAFPTLHTICSKWLPTKERGFTFSSIHNGAEFGTVIGLPLAGVLSNSNFLGGWPSVFYVFGCVGVLWYVFWWFLAFESPTVHPRISEIEKNYIQDNIESKAKKQDKVPWLKLLTSVPLWASAVAWCCSNWSFSIISSDLPTFLDSILHFNLEANGLLSSIPHIFNMVAQSVSGLLSDLALRKNLMSITTARKAVHFIFATCSALAFVGVCLARCDRVAVMVCIVIGAGLQGSLIGSVAVALIDMAPDYAGTLMGLVNAVGNASSFIVPVVVGALNRDGNTLAQWHKCFYLTAGLVWAGCLIYAAFGSSRLQPWAQAEEEQTVAPSSLSTTTEPVILRTKQISTL